MNKHFVILSEGEYSDYTPTYYIGDVEITQEEFDKKALELGDKLIEQYELLPDRPYIPKYNFETQTSEKYNPETNERVRRPWGSDFIKVMEKWLIEEKGYEKLPTEIAEIRCEYDFPTSKNGTN